MTTLLDSKVSSSQCTSSQCLEFVEGLSLLKESEIQSALNKFHRACYTSTSDDFYHNKYVSYLGLTRVLMGDSGGVEQCRKAANMETFDGDVFLNLAYAELHMNSRQRSIDVLEKGLEIDEKHPGLNKFRQQLGTREFTAFEFIARNSLLNVAVGRLSRRKTSNAGVLEFAQLM